MKPQRQIEAEIQAKRAAVMATLTKCTAEGRAMSDDERLESNKLQAEIQTLESDLVRARASLERDLHAADVVDWPDAYRGAPRPGATSSFDDDPPSPSLPPLPRRTVRTISALFSGASADPTAGMTGMRETLSRCVNGHALAGPLALGTEGVPTDGGFAVPDATARDIFSRTAEQSLWLRIGARLESMVSSELKIAALDDSTDVDDEVAALKAGWTGEGVASSAQTLKLRRVDLHAGKLVVYASATNELVEDGRSYLETLMTALSSAIAKKLDRSILIGSGLGMPLGILNAPACVTVDKAIGQAAASLEWCNICSMFAALASGSHEKAVWVVHPSCLPELLSMAINAGTAGFAPRPGFESDGKGGYTLLGRPAFVSSRVNALGQRGDILLIDGSQICIGIRKDITIDTSLHVLFDSDSLTVRARFRGDSRPLWDSAKVLADGVTTVSPIVTLAAR
ncbi:MAG: phage major capsid protein [Vicinamibacteria bacterium]|nr:phage major capsid protein [Vicinamibacteria bacterium]